ncbi:protein RETICULATA-RELATED 4, chloroplastic-like [Juglans microcarpa x Juglans regia]|uniref:protein RETICULATA-RELATED 4, chloroplastic-like n=1 Tax=Juglans microcarpa x Juglans regia TaxID=2249226 RepID=UPI001B7E6612|nr:protein RETICULATA-RELATED 4, chloroplastic-like [Juglans microcarpa x Juglans regia]
MAIAFCFNPSLSLLPLPKFQPHRPFASSSSSPVINLGLTVSPAPALRHHRNLFTPFSIPNDAVLSGGDDGDDGKKNKNNGNNGNNGGGGWGGAENAGDKNREEAIMVLAEAGRLLESLPKDLRAAIEAGKVPGSVVERFLELEKSGLFRWLMQFGGFRERLLADDLFLAKVGIECGVGIFTKTAAEYERRRENFFNELEIVFADVVMAICADFMLVYLPAPTVSLRPPLAISAGAIAKFFHNCPDNAFQVALAGTSYSFLQRLGAVLRNGTKLFAVGTASSLVGTAVTNALINARKAVDKSSPVEVENVPILSTSAAYGVYMAISSNLRYQVLAGVIEQRILEPLLHKHKLMLSAICFAVRTGNTYLGSLLWVDYARWIGIQ